MYCSILGRIRRNTLFQIFILALICLREKKFKLFKNSVKIFLFKIFVLTMKETTLILSSICHFS